MQLLLSCEHAGNQIPPECVDWIGPETHTLLATHRGWDIGILPLAQAVSQALHLPLHYSEVSRLIVDLNRSLWRSTLFGPEVKRLDQAKKDYILQNFYYPQRERVMEQARKLHQHGPVLHLALHSFTPIWKGKPRKTQLGLLHDPHRPKEQAFAIQWQKQLKRQLPDFAIHRNLPYRGATDGLTTTLRQELGENYFGFEVEFRNNLLASPEQVARLTKALVTSLQACGALPAP